MSETAAPSESSITAPDIMTETGSADISETGSLTTTSKTITTTDTAEENSSAKELTAKGSTGYYRYSFGNTEFVLNGSVEEERNSFVVSEGDKIGTLTIEKIINYESQKQICFSGEIILSGLLYRESGNSDAFSDRMDLGWLLFFPDPSGFPDNFPILQEYVEFEDKTASCSLSASTEPLLLTGEYALNECTEELFRESDYTWAEIKITDIQLRKELDWFLIPYESAARDFEILSAESLEQFVKRANPEQEKLSGDNLETIPFSTPDIDGDTTEQSH